MKWVARSCRVAADLLPTLVSRAKMAAMRVAMVWLGTSADRWRSDETAFDLALARIEQAGSGRVGRLAEAPR